MALLQQQQGNSIYTLERSSILPWLFISGHRIGPLLASITAPPLDEMGKKSYVANSELQIELFFLIPHKQSSQ
jgi:hypothetical protein